MRRVRQALAMAGVASLSLLATPWVGTAVASHLTCGQVVTSSTALESDLGPCPGDGLVIGASDVTLDLKGHRIIGSGDIGNNSVGVRIPRRHDVTVKNGTVSAFNAGIAIVGGWENTVSNVVARDNIGQEFGDFGDGMSIMSSRDNTIIHSAAIHNGPFDGIGVFGATSTGNRIVRNVVEDNNVPVSVILPKDFMGLEDFANCPCRFDFDFSDDEGINLGLLVGGSNQTSVLDNVVRRNAKQGIVACSDKGIPCVSKDNVIAGNVVEDNGFIPGDPPTFSGGGGIRVVVIADGPDATPAIPTHDLVRNNQVRDNAADGILVASLENRIVANTALGNNAAGVDGHDLRDNNDDCDANVWQNNVFGTAYPECTTVGGRQRGAAAATRDASPNPPSSAETPLVKAVREHRRPLLES